MARGPEVIAKIGADAGGYNSAMGSVAASSAVAGGAILGMKGKLAILGTAIGVLGAGLAVKGFVNLIKQATTTFVMFEDQMIRTQAIVGATAEEAKILEDSIRGVAKETSFTATEVAQMGEILALAGLSVDEMRTAVDELDTTAGNAVENMVMFAIVAGTDAETAAGIGIAAVKAFRLEINQLEQVTSVLTNTFTSSFVNLQQLGDSMRFFAPVAAAAGVSVAEAAAAVGALGNAGLQGSIAGTGLRQALLKVIAPSDDARRTIDRLGLTLVTLTDSGEQAQLGLTSTMHTIQSLERQLEGATADVEALNRELTDLSIEQERNSIAIGRIRQRASRMGRDLTRSEIQQIERLESANTDLGLTQRELALESAEVQKEQKKITDSIRDEGSEFRRLKTIVESQTTGVVSLASVLDQLNESGATTAEILEIFAIRGGGAVLALLSQADAFKEMANANQLAFDGVTETSSTVKDFVDILTGSTLYALQTTKSKFEELLLVIGEPFGLLMDQEDGVLDVMNKAIDHAASLGDVWKDIAQSMQDHLIPALREAIEPKNVEKFVEALRAVPGIMQAVGEWLQKIARIIEPILDKLLAGMDALGIGGDPTTGGGSQRDARFMGKEGESRMDSLRDIGAFALAGAATGGTAGAVGGPGGAVGGGIAGFIAGALWGTAHEFGQGAMADTAWNFEDTQSWWERNMPAWAGGQEEGAHGLHTGGIVTRPILAELGERGPEAVIPLDRFSGMGETVINLNFDSINIGSGNAVTAGDVRAIMEGQMPQIIRSSLRRGARGVM